MRISRITRFRRRVVAGLIIPLLLWCVDASAFVPQAAQEKVKAVLKGVEIGSGFVVIKYEFSPAAPGSYDVSINLMKQDDLSFKIPVRSASGDIGVVKSTTGTLEVRWDYAKDYPPGLASDEYYFQINVNKVSDSSSNLWYYIGGALVVVGGVVAYLVFGKKAASPTELPVAPARPNQ